MKASDELIAALNAQVGHELAASHQYVAIAAYFDAEALPQLALFFYRQADEEREHAMKIVKFLLDVGGAVEIPAVPAPRAAFDSVEAAVGLAVENEERVTGQIYELVERARDDKDYIAMKFLDWFVDEQREEMATMGALLQVVRRAGPDNILPVEDYLARSGGPPLESGTPADGG